MAAPRSPSPNLHRKSTTSFAHSKENEKAAARPRSPAIQPPKGSKSFMAPTISAASKVTAPSPRKKILQERNESVPPLPDPLEVPAKELVPEIGLKSKMGLASPEVYGGIKNQRTIIVPADAEQCPPPYDPKTNYLSPRPRFLHYRPNPRIENYVAIERDGKRLEDSFSSESDGDVTDEKDSEEEEPPSKVTTHVAEPELETEPCEPPHSSPRSKLVPVDEPLVVKSHVDEPSHVTAPVDEPLVAKTRVDEPSRSSLRSKLVAFLVIVAIGCALVPLAGLLSPSSGLLEDLHLDNYMAVANVKLYDVAGRFKHWSSDAIAYLNSLESYSREVGLITPVNITSSAEDEAMYSAFIYSHGDKIEQSEVEASEVAKDDGEENEVGDLNYELDKAKAMEDADYEIENADTEAAGNVLEAEFSAEEFDMEVTDNGETDIEEVASQEDVEFIADMEEAALQESETIENCQDSSDEDVESRVEDKFEVEVPENIGTHVEKESETTEDHDEFGELGLAEEDQISTAPMSSEAIFGLSSAVLLIFAVSAFLYVKQRKSPLATKGRQASKNAGSVSDSYTPAKVYRGRNEDSAHDLCQPEASSSLTDTYQMRRSGEGVEEDLRYERRPRRDSTASSMSYGSFTTYERLSAKKGSKDEEVVTPVRRSSRLRSQATTSS